MSLSDRLTVCLTVCLTACLHYLTRRFLTPVVAVGAVDLASKLPWSSKYECHSSRRIGAMEIMEATGAPVYENMFDDDQGQREEAKHDPAPPPGAGNAAGARTSGGEGHAGGVVPFTWSGTSTSGAEIRTANPMNAAAGGGTGGGAVVAPAPVDGAGGVGVMGVGSDGDMAVPEKEIIEIMGQEDEGAGVFGAILHEPGETQVYHLKSNHAPGSVWVSVECFAFDLVFVPCSNHLDLGMVSLEDVDVDSYLYRAQSALFYNSFMCRLCLSSFTAIVHCDGHLYVSIPSYIYHPLYTVRLHIGSIYSSLELRCYAIRSRLRSCISQQVCLNLLLCLTLSFGHHIVPLHTSNIDRIARVLFSGKRKSEDGGPGSHGKQGFESRRRRR